MSELGQTRKYSLRAYRVRFGPESGLKSDIAGGPFRANTGSDASSFDHLVGAGEQRGRDARVESLSGFEVDDQLELARRLNRKIARLLTVYTKSH